MDFITIDDKTKRNLRDLREMMNKRGLLGISDDFLTYLDEKEYHLVNSYDNTVKLGILAVEFILKC